MRYYFLLVFFWQISVLSSQNVGISDVIHVPEQSAMLDINSNKSGMLIPRMSMNQIKSVISPANGLLIFCSDDNLFYFNSGTPLVPDWLRIGTKGHYIGEFYGGGIIIWIDHTGQHGLICSLTDLSTGTEWSNITSVLIGTATSDWDGQTNTTEIINQPGHLTSAAQICNDYINPDYGTGIYTDWYLPSVTELKHIRNHFYELNKALDTDADISTQILSKTEYWASREASNVYVHLFSFDNAAANTMLKTELYYVRAVRRF